MALQNVCNYFRTIFNKGKQVREDGCGRNIIYSSKYILYFLGNMCHSTGETI